MPPPSINSVIDSTDKDPPNSSTDGAKIIKWSYKNSPYFESTRLASSADLYVNVNPLSVNKKLKIVKIWIFDDIVKMAKYFTSEAKTCFNFC